MIVPGELQVSHIGLFVSDLSSMEEFYREVLGFIVTDRGSVGEAEVVFLSQSPEDHHQIVFATGRPENLGFNVVNQLSLRAMSLEALRRLSTTLTARRVQNVESVFHGPTISVYFPDPEGTRIEVFIDTPWYVNQPARLPVDLTTGSDEELMEELARVAASLPGFISAAEWREAFAAKLADAMADRRSEGSGERRDQA